jgi:hypothetical protein
MADNYGKCDYQQDSHTFLATEFNQIAHYDSGGGIDAIDFEPIEHIISFKEAYNMYVNVMEFMNTQIIVPSEPVAPYCPTEDDIELPF